ncbi:MAG: hypothetical protein RIS22_1072 [Actinomycetota bacterium]
MNVVHEIERASVGVNHLGGALRDGEDERVDPHLALHGADDVQ